MKSRDVRIARALIANTQLSPKARWLLGFLLDHRNKDTGQCNPKRITLAIELGFSLPTVTRLLKELRNAGLILVSKKPRTNSYIIVTDQFDQAEFSTASSKRSGMPDQFDQSPPPVSLYEPIQGEPIEAAALSQVQVARAAAAQKHKKKTKTKPPVSATDDGTFRIVREWLYALAPLVHLPPPDDALVRAVITAARGAPAKDITAALVAIYKAGHLRNMRSWGFIPLKIGDCARSATA